MPKQQKPLFYKYEYGRLFKGATPGEVDEAIQQYLNPKPVEKPQPKKGRR